MIRNSSGRYSNGSVNGSKFLAVLRRDPSKRSELLKILRNDSAGYIILDGKKYKVNPHKK